MEDLRFLDPNQVRALVAKHTTPFYVYSRTNLESAKYVVIGHCCESSDMLTTELNNPEQIAPRPL